MVRFDWSARLRNSASSSPSSLLLLSEDITNTGVWWLRGESVDILPAMQLRPLLQHELDRCAGSYWFEGEIAAHALAYWDKCVGDSSGMGAERLSITRHAVSMMLLAMLGRLYFAMEWRDSLTRIWEEMDGRRLITLCMIALEQAYQRRAFTRFSTGRSNGTQSSKSISFCTEQLGEPSIQEAFLDTFLRNARANVPDTQYLNPANHNVQFYMNYL